MKNLSIISGGGTSINEEGHASPAVTLPYMERRKKECELRK